MLSDITFGQYYQTQSFVHKMDAVTKILLLIAYIVMIFLVKNFYSFIVIGIVIATMFVFSKVPIGSMLKSIKLILFVVIITTVVNLFSYEEEGAKTLVKLFWGLKITDKSLIFSAFMALRLILLVLGSCFLTLTTTPVALTDGIEVILYPLSLIKFPVHELALIMSIALRFIPSLLEEVDRIMNAQKARGADFESGNLLKRVKALVPVFIPLLVSSFRRAEELGDAMDSRCYSGSKGRTKYKKTHIGVRDFVATAFIVISFVAVILINGNYPSII